jgi:hypothetical protein
VLSGQLLGCSQHGFVRSGLQYLDGSSFSWNMNHQRPLYAGYYITQAKFHEGGARWDQWNAQFAKELVMNQAKDGHWDSWGGGEANRGPVYSTTLACLMLEVYYRFLPTYKAPKAELFGAGDFAQALKADDEVAIAVEAVE